MARQVELFSQRRSVSPRASAPLAERLRPRTLEEVAGQRHLVEPGRPLHGMITRGRIESLILWGPPGCGKTTIARVLAASHGGPVAHFSAVLHGVKELRAIVAEAARVLDQGGEPTLVFVDEIHRFNKAQQDAFLPHIEAGTIVMIGATTENPSFEVIAPLLSRTKVVVLEPLDEADLLTVVDRALADAEHGLGRQPVELTDDARGALARYAHGDARIALGILDSAVATVPDDHTLTADHIATAAQQQALPHDKAGDAHFDLLSAFIKSMRDSDPDAAVYWLMRMLEAGEEPMTIARRLVVFAAEDVGLAAPEALGVAVATKDAVHFVGLPEGRIPLASTTVFLATCPKSNAAYAAMNAATDAVREFGPLPVPLHLRNAPTGLARDLGHGGGYQYAHDDPDALTGQAHLPDELTERQFYEPTDRGWEKAGAAWLARARQRRR